MIDENGAPGLERALKGYYTEPEVKASLQDYGSRQTQNKRLHALRKAAGVLVRGMYFYRRRETDRFFATPLPRIGRPVGSKNRKELNQKEVSPPVRKPTITGTKKKTAVKKAAVKKASVKKARGRKK